MGEVWKARDTRLDRSVAIKVLPPEFAENAQHRLRFEREAKTISQLNHPHICTLFDVGDGYLVMELLEGEPLSERLSKGPLPVEQVIRYGVQIAEALERAHKAGVVHRDLKPGNVMITKSGAKLLDFGLAKPNESGVLTALTTLRTEKRANLTEEGTIVGTIQYMAPEQLEGGNADTRTDIFALGATLYEMATGRRAFEGKTKASLIASILTAEPQPISAVQPMTPATFDRVVRKCLEKDPDDRWQSAQDVATALRWSIDAPAGSVQHRPSRARLAWSVAAAFAVLAAIAGGMWWRERTRIDEAPITRTYLLPPDKTTYVFAAAGPPAAPPAVSPDGRRIVFGAGESGKPHSLWIRSLDGLIAQPLSGTESARYPFWSPDGRFVAFFTTTAMKKVEVSGGAAVTLCLVDDARGGSWSPDGKTIIFAGRYTPIMRIDSSGGKPVEVTKLDSDTASHRWPQFFPDGRRFIYLSSPNGSDDPRNTLMAGSIDGKLRKPLITAASDGNFLDGFLIFVRDRILTAQAIDVDSLTTKGEAFPLRELPLLTTPLLSRSVLSVSPSGTVVYQTGTLDEDAVLTWFDRAGKPLGTVGDPQPYGSVALAPDASAVVVGQVPAPQRSLTLFDLVRGSKRRLTFNPGADLSPVVSPDGTRVAYATSSSGRYRLIVRNLATGAEETLLDEEAIGNPVVTSWSPDGERILFTYPHRQTRGDIWWMSLKDRKPQSYLTTQWVETAARFSPDGKWVAYQSAESGPDVYLAPFPPTGAKWQVSTAGGTNPRWRRDGKELFYVNGKQMMAASVSLGESPVLGAPVKLFEYRAIGGVGSFDVTADGQRFLCVTRLADEPPPPPLILVQNFGKQLRDAAKERSP